ncbi:hypothetical protein SLA2020_134720 [Shorea laevis]
MNKMCGSESGKEGKDRVKKSENAEEIKQRKMQRVKKRGSDFREVFFLGNRRKDSKFSTVEVTVSELAVARRRQCDDLHLLAWRNQRGILQSYPYSSPIFKIMVW